jgi:hypothetical protein
MQQAPVLTSEALRIADAIDAAETTEGLAAALEGVSDDLSMTRSQKIVLWDRAIDRQVALARVGK